eukprot:TRINITY_DN5363_c0_g1_i1.p1 TRINITY_DN5363_c0_g1~~TRINITY_DN5363_c0_g1_i1.p1  ORF type:complete len:146 (+),score=16.44 TRINITY_DN5363_c0_g1_i1:32-469(+)
MLCEGQSRDSGVRTDRQQILDLEHQLLEARGRLEDLKEWMGVRKSNHKDGESDCCACILQHQRVQIRNALFPGLDSQDVLPDGHANFHSAAESVWRPGEEERMGFDQTGANTDGLLLAVDKFLSSEDRVLPADSTGYLPGQASSD